MLESELGEVWVEGELSNVRKPASGHWYFTLKDASAQLRCVLFRGDRNGALAQPEDGLKVRVFGRITVYEAGGQYQLVAGALNALRVERDDGLDSREVPFPLLAQ